MKVVTRALKFYFVADKGLEFPKCVQNQLFLRALWEWNGSTILLTTKLLTLTVMRDKIDKFQPTNRELCSDWIECRNFSGLRAAIICPNIKNTRRVSHNCETLNPFSIIFCFNGFRGARSYFWHQTTLIKTLGQTIQYKWRYRRTNAGVEEPNTKN